MDPNKKKYLSAPLEHLLLLSLEFISDTCPSDPKYAFEALILISHCSFCVVESTYDSKHVLNIR